MIHRARQHEEPVGQPVHVGQDSWINLAGAKRHDGAFGAPADSTRQVQQRAGGAPAGQNEAPERRQIGLDTQHYLLNNVLARLDYSAPVSRFADWTYVKNEVFATWFGSNFLYANTWLDQSDPTYSGRA